MSWVPVFTMCQVTQRTVYEQMCSQMGKDVMEAQFTARTIRLVLPVNLSGDGIRISFRNADSGTGKLNKVTVAKCAENGDIMEDTVQSVTFDGKTRLILEGRKIRKSDILPLNVTAGDYLAVSVYNDYPNLSSNSIDAMMIQSEAGDFCDVTFQNCDPTTEAMRRMGWYMPPQFPLLSGIEIETEEPIPAVISCLGDSITQQGYWFKPLLERICREYPGKAVLLNAGIGGNRLCKDSPENFGTQFGKAGVSRMDEDVFDLPFLDTVIFALGINDLLDGESANDPEPAPSAQEFGRGCRMVAERAKRAGVRSAAFTLYPALLDEDPGKAKKKELLFHAYNDEIRKAGFDKVIELDPILKDTEEKQRYRDGLSQPDGLHLNEKGGQILADGINLTDFM